MNNYDVQTFVQVFSGRIDSPLWKEDESVPKDFSLKIDVLLLYNQAFVRYVLSHRNEITDFQLHSVIAMLKCARNECGGITYGCSDCGEIKFVPFLCHSRFCPICGKRYSEQWGRKLMKRFFPKDHRHVIFTLPKVFWELVKSRADVLINDLFEAAKTVIYRLFKDRFKNYRVRPGIICIVHYSGRDMKYNPHIHMLVTEGGLSPVGVWKRHSFWCYELMCVYWKYEVLKRFRYHCRDSLEAKAIVEGEWTKRFKNNTNGYVVKNYRDVLDVKKIGSYLARYVRHSPIGESRILAFNGKDVLIKHEWDNKIEETTISIEHFIEAILSNIPPKGFREVRQYGLYSNLFYRWAKGYITFRCFSREIVSQSVRGAFKVEARCPNCGGVMKPLFIEYIHRDEWMQVFF